MIKECLHEKWKQICSDCGKVIDRSLAEVEQH